MQTKRDRAKGRPAPRERPRRFEPRAHERSDDANAFMPDPEGGPARAPEDLSESLGEEFVEAATSGGNPDAEVLDARVPEDIGGPFVETTAEQEMGASVDDTNPRDAEREPLPRPVAGLVTDPEIDERIDAQRARGGGDDMMSDADASEAEPPDPERDVDALNADTLRDHRRT